MEEQNKKFQQTILVTGGAGYIGSITTKALLDNGYGVVVLDNLETGHREAIDQRAIFEFCDLANQEKINAIFRKYQIDAVIDFAAYIAVGESMVQPKRYLDNNVTNFVRLLDCLKSNNAKLLVKSSTAAVYGTPKDEDLPLKEDYTEKYKSQHSALLAGKWDDQDIDGNRFFDLLIKYYHDTFADRPELALSDEEIIMLRIPPSVYGFTKLLDEIVMRKYDGLFRLRYCTLRYFNVAGAERSGKMGQDNQNPTHIFASAIFQALGKKDKLTIFGDDYPTQDGTGIRDYIHVEDLASGHLAALEYLFSGEKSATFNLGTGQGYSVLEVIKAIEKASGKKIKYSFGPRRSGDVATLYADPTYANEILHWKAKYSLDDMAKSAWKWHGNNPDGYTGSSQLTVDNHAYRQAG